MEKRSLNKGQHGRKRGGGESAGRVERGSKSDKQKCNGQQLLREKKDNVTALGEGKGHFNFKNWGVIWGGVLAVKSM